MDRHFKLATIPFERIRYARQLCGWGTYQKHGKLNHELRDRHAESPVYLKPIFGTRPTHKLTRQGKGAVSSLWSS